MALDRASILNQSPVLPREEVDVPEWGGSVFVRTLTATERDNLEVQWEKTQRLHFRARLAVACVCDEKGVNTFLGNDIAELGRHSTKALGRVCEVAFRLNAFTKEDVEELEKNSESGQADDC